MLRLTAIFIATCIVAIAASAGALAFLLLGLSPTESAIVTLAALTALILFNTVSARVRDRSDIGGHIADLSRGTADLARQVGELGRKVAAFESEAAGLERRVRAVTAPVTLEIAELGNLVRSLAETVTAHEARLAELAGAAPAALAVSEEELPEADPQESAPAAEAAPPAASEEPAMPAQPEKPAEQDKGYFRGKSREEIAAFIRTALDAGRIDLYLQPIVTLPQRKVRYYEALARLRAEDDTVVLPADFLRHAESAGLMPRIDNLMLFRCVQVLRRLVLKNRDVGLFCNISVSTLNDAEFFPQFSQFMEANRALAPSLTLELPQRAWQAMGPLEEESLAAFAERGFRFSMDQVADLRMEPRDLAERGIRFVKVPAALLLDSSAAPADIHAGDLSDLLGRHGISLIAERIESEPAVVDLLDYEVRFGQGFLFSAPRPVRAEALQSATERGDLGAREAFAPGSRPLAALATPPGVRAAGA